MQTSDTGTDADGRTALHYAAADGDVRVVERLLDAGADSRVKNQLGLTALDFATRYHAKDVADGLRDMYAREAAAASAASGASIPAQNGAK